MRKQFYTVILFIGTTLLICSCSKEPTPVSIDRPNIPPPPPVPVKEYFWEKAWQKTGNDFEIKLQSPALTDSAINKGIKVQVAIYTDWSLFNDIPLTLTEIGLPDTVNLSYSVQPGNLRIVAKAPFEITWPSDVVIVYQ
jgi:hypothetical protein